jgi:hypothetical protein
MYVLPPGASPGDATKILEASSWRVFVVYHAAARSRL